MSDLIERPKQELIEFLRAEAAQYPYVRGLYDAIDALEAMRDALQFYADPGDYKSPRTGGLGKLYFDCGDVARAALARLEAK